MRIKPHPWLWFLTLTLDGSANPERETFSWLARGWKHVRQYLKRHGMVHYTWVREQGHNATRRVHLRYTTILRGESAGDDGLKIDMQRQWPEQAWWFHGHEPDEACDDCDPREMERRRSMRARKAKQT